MVFVIIFKKLKRFISKENLTSLFIYVTIITLVTSLLFYYFEKDENPGIEIYADSIWWTIVTFTTVGYGDISPVTIEGKIVATFAMFFGIGFIGSLMATIASFVIQSKGKELRGMKQLKLKDHIIICGYDKLKFERFIKEFRCDKRYNKFPIVLITNTIDEHPMQDDNEIYFIRGESTDEEVLERASIRTASRVIVLAESVHDTSSDEKTILTVLLVEEINPNIYTCAEIIDPHKKSLLKRAHCDEVISPSELSINLIVQAIQDPGITKVVEDLVTNTEGQQFKKAQTLSEHHNKPFSTLFNQLLDKGCLVFALDKKGKQIINPAQDTIVDPEDYYFYISN